jgi:hypothetical protein
VGVKLGVETSAGVLTEHRSNDAVTIDTHDMTMDTHTGVGVLLDPAQDGVD